MQDPLGTTEPWGARLELTKNLPFLPRKRTTQDSTLRKRLWIESPAPTATWQDKKLMSAAIRIAGCMLPWARTHD
jgi:hypothetical protein